MKDDSLWNVEITISDEGVSFKEAPIQSEDDKSFNVSGAQPKAVSEGDPIQSEEHPLLIATKTGILEIVYGMLEEHPQIVEHVDERGHNILHVAVMYRRKEIFNHLMCNTILLARMSPQIDHKGYTLLHQVADNTHYSGGSKSFPFHMQHVKKVIPSYYAEFRLVQHDKTAKELFNEMHKAQLEKAQQWIKDTTQSCSAVAVLIATIVFAAAYTVPGGFNEKGIPIFLHKHFFLFFTVMDVVALASSLTSVVMFLSILTSPFEYEDFYSSIPRKLTLGFILLFFSMMATMLAFATTILLIIQTEKQWTAGLISIAAFLPVSIFASMQFRLYSAFRGSMKGFFREIRKYLPWSCVPPLFPKRKHHWDFGFEAEIDAS